MSIYSNSLALPDDVQQQQVWRQGNFPYYVASQKTWTAPISKDFKKERPIRYKSWLQLLYLVNVGFVRNYFLTGASSQIRSPQEISDMLLLNPCCLLLASSTLLSTALVIPSRSCGFFQSSILAHQQPLGRLIPEITILPCGDQWIDIADGFKVRREDQGVDIADGFKVRRDGEEVDIADGF